MFLTIYCVSFVTGLDEVSVTLFEKLQEFLQRGGEKKEKSVIKQINKLLFQLFKSVFYSLYENL